MRPTSFPPPNGMSYETKASSYNGYTPTRKHYAHDETTENEYPADINENRYDCAPRRPPTASYEEPMKRRSMSPHHLQDRHQDHHQDYSYNNSSADDDRDHGRKTPTQQWHADDNNNYYSSYRRGGERAHQEGSTYYPYEGYGHNYYHYYPRPAHPSQSYPRPPHPTHAPFVLPTPQHVTSSSSVQLHHRRRELGEISQQTSRAPSVTTVDSACCEIRNNNSGNCSAAPSAPWENDESSLSSNNYNNNSSSSDSKGNLKTFDIVCGRGAPTNFHYGNQIFRELVQDYQTSYLCARRSDKPRIAMKLLDVVKSRGARFVRRQKVTGGRCDWVEIGDKGAYEKVCQALREGSPDLRRQMLSVSTSQSKRKSRNQGGREDDKENGGNHS